MQGEAGKTSHEDTNTQREIQCEESIYIYPALPDLGVGLTRWVRGNTYPPFLFANVGAKSETAIPKAMRSPPHRLRGESVS